MTINIASKLTNYIIENGNIKEDDKDIYEYGFNSAIAMVCNTAAFILICYIFNMFFEGIIYGSLFMILRVYAGGVHLSNSIKCFFMSCAILIVSLIVVRYTTMDKILILVVTALGSIIIWFLAPVEDANKPLDELEKKIYRIRARTCLSLEVFIIILLLFCNYVKIAYLVSIILNEIVIIMILGIIKNRLTSKMA